MKDFLIIVRRNFASPIMIAILVLAAILLVLGESRDAWFISSIIILNTLLAIVQELRARNELKKLELMSAPLARRLDGDGNVTEVPFDQLIVGDNVKLETGDEVPADGVITTSSGLESDESILTGESAPVDKPTKSTVYAASAIVAGSATMQVTAIGASSKIGSMTAVLKRYNPELTPIQRSIAQAITYLTYGALGLATLILVVYTLSGQDAIEIFKTITSAAVSVVPEGLLLASSLLLAYGSIKLAQAKVLPQKLAAIEAMALMDILCVDKTGTLTSDSILFESIEVFDDKITNLTDLVGIVAAETSSGSKTGDVIISGVPAPKQYKVLDTLAFSSARKISGTTVKLGGVTYQVLMGAPEFLEPLAPVSAAGKKRIDELTGVGKRVLLVAIFDAKSGSIKEIADKSGVAAGIVVLSNALREGVEHTVNYLQTKGVSIRVISGDNPNTVAYIAASAGIANSDKVLTGAELQKISDADWDAVVSQTTIFARVLPEQKERLVDTFKRLGNFTAMVGDGINDALAIKKSDLGVAMYAGAAATRRVADIVLLNNSFNSLPLGMKLGNRIMQAIEIIATLFFHKIIYSVVLLLSTLALQIVYPFEPRHITFMNMFLVSMPTLMWTIFTPRPTHRVSPRYFWHDTLLAVAPIAAISGLVVTISYSFLRMIHPTDLTGVSTTTVIIATLFGIYLVFLVPKMFGIRNNREARLARLLYILAVTIVVMMSFGIGFMRDFYDFTTPAWQNTLPLAALIVSAAIFQWIIAVRAGKRLVRRKVKH